MNAHGITPQIYPAILARNDTVDRPEREWSRDVWRTTIPLPTPTSKVVVVFSDAGVSSYITDVIRDNLTKNNVVIQVVRGEATDVSLSIHPNHLVKHRANPSAPLFFPRVDECYYTTRIGDTLYDIMREVSNVIDLWDSHEQMKLYVVKQSRYGDGDDDDDDDESESGTEGFDSDDDIYAKPQSCDYAPAIFEEYFTKVLSVIPNQKRGLVVLF
jgi:hypothetical protein